MLAGAKERAQNVLNPKVAAFNSATGEKKDRRNDLFKCKATEETAFVKGAAPRSFLSMLMNIHNMNSFEKITADSLHLKIKGKSEHCLCLRNSIRANHG